MAGSGSECGWCGGGASLPSLMTLTEECRRGIPGLYETPPTASDSTRRAAARGRRSLRTPVPYISHRTRHHTRSPLTFDAHWVASTERPSCGEARPSDRLSERVNSKRAERRGSAGRRRRRSLRAVSAHRRRLRKYTALSGRASGDVWRRARSRSGATHAPSDTGPSRPRSELRRSPRCAVRRGAPLSSQGGAVGASTPHTHTQTGGRAAAPVRGVRLRPVRSTAGRHLNGAAVPVKPRRQPRPAALADWQAGSRGDMDGR